jgi:hypothetical protein
MACDCPHCRLRAALIAAIEDIKTDEDRGKVSSIICSALQGLYPISDLHLMEGNVLVIQQREAPDVVN